VPRSLEERVDAIQLLGPGVGDSETPLDRVPVLDYHDFLALPRAEEFDRHRERTVDDRRRLVRLTFIGGFIGPLFGDYLFLHRVGIEPIECIQTGHRHNWF
jgi:hypothetical protein